MGAESGFQFPQPRFFPLALGNHRRRAPTARRRQRGVAGPGAGLGHQLLCEERPGPRTWPDVVRCPAPHVKGAPRFVLGLDPNKGHTFENKGTRETRPTIRGQNWGGLAIWKCDVQPGGVGTPFFGLFLQGGQKDNYLSVAVFAGGQRENLFWWTLYRGRKGTQKQIVWGPRQKTDRKGMIFSWVLDPSFRWGVWRLMSTNHLFGVPD